MKDMYWGVSVDDVALRHWSDTGNFKKLLDFFREEKVAATFGVVPVDEETDRNFDAVFPAYTEILKRAVQDGFGIFQHGLRHNRFEFGTPPQMILNIPHEAENKRYSMEHAAEIAADHTCERLRSRLRRGREILEQALGIRIRGFRAPALQESPAMYEALAAENYLYDSSQYMQITGWLYKQTGMRTPAPIERKQWDALRRKGKITILPLMCDYTWQLQEENFDWMFGMASGDYIACRKARIPFVSMSHVNPVWDGCGIKLLKALFDFARDDAAKHNYEIHFSTLDNIAEIYNSSGAKSCS